MNKRIEVLMIGISIGLGLLVAYYIIWDGKSTGHGGDSALKNRIVSENDAAQKLLNASNYKEGLEMLKKAERDLYLFDPSLEDVKSERKLSDPVLDAPLSNMSWAYNGLGEYEQSLAVIRKSLLLLPNTAEEYVNEGNALYGLNRNEEALASFDRALALDKKMRYAYYGKGAIHYDTGRYREALQDLDRYLHDEPHDMDAAEKKMNALLKLDENDEALAYGNQLVAQNADDYDAYRLKNEALKAKADFKTIQAFEQSVSAKFPDNAQAQSLLGMFYDDTGRLDEAEAYYRQLLKGSRADIPYYIALMNVKSKQKDIQAALGLYKQALKLDATDPDPDLYKTMGRIYADSTDYMAAVPYYEEAIKRNQQDEQAAIGKLRALYRAKRNLQCAAYAKAAEKVRTTRSDIAFYSGKCNEELGRNKEAAAYFQRAVEVNPSDSEAYAELATVYLAMHKDSEALAFSKKTLALSANDPDARYVENELKERKKPLGERVKAFFAASYMYGERVKDWKSLLSLLDKPDITPDEIAAIIDRVRLPGDPFTFTIVGDDYDAMQAGDDGDVSVQTDGSEVYMRISDFGRNTDDRFLAALDHIRDPGDKTLIIDLRGNSGGLAVSANNMLDALLPEVVMSTILYKDGRSEPYLSDASHIDFKHIYLLVDEHSASASELLTLGLRTYLPNVTVVGRATVGKGVGQQVFMDDEHRLAVFAVNFYWNVRERNIMGTGIKPDIIVRGDKLADFMKPVREGRK